MQLSRLTHIDLFPSFHGTIPVEPRGDTYNPDNAEVAANWLRYRHLRRPKFPRSIATPSPLTAKGLSHCTIAGIISRSR
jgi:hypothetical protein